MLENSTKVLPDKPLKLPAVTNKKAAWLFFNGVNVHREANPVTGCAIEENLQTHKRWCAAYSARNPTFQKLNNPENDEKVHMYIWIGYCIFGMSGTLRVGMCRASMMLLRRFWLCSWASLFRWSWRCLMCLRGWGIFRRGCSKVWRLIRIGVSVRYLIAFSITTLAHGQASRNPLAAWNR